MKKIKYIIIIMVILSFTLVGCNKNLSKTANTNFKNNRGLLWEVKNKNTTVYLLGSFHVGKKEVYKFNKETQKAFDRSDTVCFEVNLNDAKSLDIPNNCLFYAENDNIFNHISKEGAEKLTTCFKEVGLDINKYKQYKIWNISSILLDVQMKKIGYNSEYGIDFYVYNKANNVKKISGFETCKYQAHILDSMSDYEQEKDMFCSVCNLKSIKTSLDEEYNIILAGDDKKLENIANHYRTASTAGYKVLVAKRNINFANKIIELLKSNGTYFVVIGSMHFSGDDSIVKLLEKKGYTVKRIEG